MLICLTFFIIYALSVLTCTFSVFRLNPSIKRWIDKTEEATASSLAELAQLSDKQALQAFGRYFLGAAIVALVLFASLKDMLSAPAQRLLAVSAFIFFYFSGSIGAWSNKRAEITKKLWDDTRHDSGRYTKYYLMFVAVLLLVLVVVGRELGEQVFANFGPVVLFFAGGLVLLIGSLVIANSMSVLFVFAPALIAIAYLWLAIFVARAALVVGKNRLINGLAVYCVVSTIYLALLSLPALRLWLSVPAICQ